jgi:tRNA(adenine34) deaminase
MMSQGEHHAKNFDSGVSAEDMDYLRRAIALGTEAEVEGNLPIGALIAKDGVVLAQAKNKVLFPEFHPGRHAEIEAMNMIPGNYLHEHSKKMTLYTTQEPCVMCLGAIILYRIGRVIYGGSDPKRGASYLTRHLTQIYDRINLPIFIGPLLPEVCDPMFARADKIYRDYRDQRV